MSALDKLAADVATLDPRLRIASDRPDCFLCGRPVRREVAVTVETGASIGLHAHAECCSGRSTLDIATHYWKAIRAAMTGERESPNPGPARVRGAFQ